MRAILTALLAGLRKSLTGYPPHTTHFLTAPYKHTHWNQGQNNH